MFLGLFSSAGSFLRRRGRGGLAGATGEGGRTGGASGVPAVPAAALCARSSRIKESQGGLRPEEPQDKGGREGGAFARPRRSAAWEGGAAPVAEEGRSRPRATAGRHGRVVAATRPQQRAAPPRAREDGARRPLAPSSWAARCSCFLVPAPCSPGGPALRSRNGGSGWGCFLPVTQSPRASSDLVLRPAGDETPVPTEKNEGPRSFRGPFERHGSGRGDLNPRRRAPKARALPGCATPRW